MTFVDIAGRNVSASGLGPLWLLGDIAQGDRRCLFEFRCPIGLANLEGSVLGRPPSVEYSKVGPRLWHNALPDYAVVRIVSLANNHVMDFGSDGLTSTLAVLNEASAVTLGAGSGLTEARKAAFIDVNGVRVALLACCERQFGAATEYSSGVAVIGPWLFEAVRTARQQADVVIVSMHAGVEMLRWPEAWRREWCHALVDAGVDIVHGHHSHIPQAYEVYEGALITYGLGNFIVDPRFWQRQINAKWSAAFEITSLKRPVQFRVHTVVCEEADGMVRVRLSAGDEAERHGVYLAECNRVLANNDLLEGVRQEAAVTLYEGSYAPWMKWATRSEFRVHRLSIRERWKRPLRALLEGICGAERVWRSVDEDYLLRYHVIACESHREMLGTALALLGGEVIDRRCSESKRLSHFEAPW
jgi:hypothetical protein